MAMAMSSGSGSVRDVVFCTDAKYLEHMMTAIVSVLHNAARPSRLRIWVAGLELEQHDWQRLDALARRFDSDLRFLDVPRSLTDDFFVSGHLSAAAYVRLFLPNLLPSSISHALYLDSDLVVERDIGTMQFSKHEDVLIAAVRNPGFGRGGELGIPEGRGYFNSGVMLMHLERMRAEEFSEKSILVARELGDKATAWDQDVLNVAVRGRWERLNDVWNVQHTFFSLKPTQLELTEDETRSLREQPAILHYSSSVKPWSYHCTHPLRERYFVYRNLAGLGIERPRPEGLTQACKRVAKLILRRP